MAIIYSYPLTTPKVKDLLIGTSVFDEDDENSPRNNPTVSFTIESLLGMIGTGGFQTLQQVTNLGASTTNAITIANGLSVTGTFTDSTGGVGTAGQVLSSTSIGTAWVSDAGGTVKSVAATHAGNAFSASIGNVATVNPSVDITMNGITAQYVNGAGNLATLLDIPGLITSLTTNGTSGVSTLVGRVLNIPNYANTQNTLTTTGTGAATLVGTVLNIPTPPTADFTSLTTTGTSGASTLTSGVLNIPNYATGGAVTSIVAGTNVTISGSTGDVTVNATVPITSLTTNGTSGASTLTSGVLNIPSYTSGGGVVTSLTTTGTSGDAATLSVGVLNIPTPVIPFTSLTTTGSGVATLTTGVLNIPNNTYTEIDTLQSVCARGNSTSTAINMIGSGASGYLYVTGNAQGNQPTNSTGMAFSYNNNAGLRENELFWNPGIVTAADNATFSFSLVNEYLDSANSNARVSDKLFKLYGNGNLELTGPTATSTIANTFWRMPTTAAPNTGYVLAKASGSINLEWVANGSTSTVVTNSFTASQIISGGTIAFNTLSVPVGKQLLVENVVFYLDHGGTTFNYPSAVTINLQYNDGFSITTISLANTTSFMNNIKDTMSRGTLPLSASYPYILGGVVITNPGDMEIVLPSGVSVGDGVLRVSIKYQELNTGASFSL